jgi:hypothetical protein
MFQENTLKERVTVREDSVLVPPTKRRELLAKTSEIRPEEVEDQRGSAKPMTRYRGSLKNSETEPNSKRG